MAGNAGNESFDPYKQPITILMADGMTPVSTDVVFIDYLLTYKTQICISYGSQFGASFMMLIVILLVTKESKRHTPIYILNVLSMFLSALRSLMQCIYWLSPFVEFYALVAGDFSAVPRSSYVTSIATSLMTLMFLAAIEASLVLQSYAVCGTLARSRKAIIVVISATISLLAVSLRFALTVQNAKSILSPDEIPDLAWIQGAALIMETLSIWYFCLIFVSKLAVTVYKRRQMNMPQWGPMQIFCIMGGCTMVIPSIFAILEYFPESTFPEAGSLALTTVAILLPLSSVWASASMDGDAPVSFNQGKSFKSFRSESSSNAGQNSYSYERKMSMGPAQLSPTTVVTSAEYAHGGSYHRSQYADRDSIDMGPENGVRVDSSYMVDAHQHVKDELK